MACIALRTGDCNDDVKQAIATKLIALANGGERNPDILCEEVVKDNRRPQQWAASEAVRSSVLPDSSFECSPRMSLRMDACRERAADAKHSAAKAKNPYPKRAFEEVAHGWLLLADRFGHRQASFDHVMGAQQERLWHRSLFPPPIPSSAC
jgi:hypothetical protein